MPTLECRVLAWHNDPLRTTQPGPAEKPGDELLGSWKEIAHHLHRSVRTVQRWQKEYELPVHRVALTKRGAVYSSRSELDQWWTSRSTEIEKEVERGGNSTNSSAVSAPRLAPNGRSPSIAVLPFVNMGSDPEQEYFSDGLAEEIIGALVKVPGLKVIARTSAFAFKGQRVDTRQIAEALGVAHVLEGSVRRSGNRLRVSAQLIAAEDAINLWSERYDRPMSDVFAIQDELSCSIARTLTSHLAPVAERSEYVPVFAAHEAFLKARFLQWRMTPEASQKSKDLYEEAIAIDPQYALAHASYADHLHGRAALGFESAHDVIPRARRMAERALHLDPNLPEAHTVLFVIAGDYDYDWREADGRLALATARGGLSPWVECELAERLFASGRKRESLDRFQRAIEGDPLHPLIRWFASMCLGALEKYEEAEAHVRYALELYPDFYIPHRGMADLYAARGMFEAALPFARTAYELAPWKPLHVGYYAALLKLTGQQEESVAVLGKMPDVERPGAPLGWAMYHLVCRNLEVAASWFDMALEQREPAVALWAQSAIAAPFRQSHYWPRIASLMNLPQTNG